MDLLLELLRTPSPPGNEGRVRKIIQREVGGQVDAAGNLWVNVGKGSTSLFLSHMDAIHNEKDVGILVRQDGMIALDPECGQRALGGDDRCGNRVMIEMIRHGIPGLYIFTVGEEVGCKGMQHACRHLPAGIKRAISFDRKGTSSVITAMSSGPCCSDAFAHALCEQLGENFCPDPTGTVTDALCLHEMVPNYTNISVGYHDEHTQNETVDSRFLLDVLVPAVLAVDWESLPDDPKPDVVGSDWFGYDEMPYLDEMETAACFFQTFESASFTGAEVCEILEATAEGWTLEDLINSYMPVR